MAPKGTKAAKNLQGRPRASKCAKGGKDPQGRKGGKGPPMASKGAKAAKDLQGRPKASRGAKRGKDLQGRFDMAAKAQRTSKGA